VGGRTLLELSGGPPPPPLKNYKVLELYAMNPLLFYEYNSKEQSEYGNQSRARVLI
jgi:hypothetical protein